MNKCPHCGSESLTVDSFGWPCGSYAVPGKDFAQQSTQCENNVLKAEIERLQGQVEWLESRVRESALPQRGLDTLDYRQAPSGKGTQAAEWTNKPHRLVYDLCGEIERLQATVAKLPKTADGVPVVPGMKLWVLPMRRSVASLAIHSVPRQDYGGYYSTPEAAEAKEKA